MMGGTPDMLRRQIDPGRGMTMQQLQEIDPGSIVREGEKPMGERLTVMQKMQMLMDMGLTEGEAIDAIAMEESAGDVNPRAFSGRDIDTGSIVREGEMSGMGALGGVPMGGQVPMPMPRPRPQMPMDMGADRTMNPMDRITSRNAPST
jgi:Fe2+ transport system protein FeoA